MTGRTRQWDLRALVWAISGLAVLICATLLYRPLGVSLIAGRTVVAVAMLSFAACAAWRLRSPYSDSENDSAATRISRRRLLGAETVIGVGGAALGIATLDTSINFAMVWVGAFLIAVGALELLAGAGRDDPAVASPALAGWQIFAGVVVATLPFRLGLDFTAYTVIALTGTGIAMLVRGIRLTLPLPRASALRWWRPMAATVQLIVLIIGIGWYASFVTDTARHHTEQSRIDAFYQVPNSIPAGAPGTVIRSAPLTLPGIQGSGLRVLYWSQDGKGQPTVSAGMVFTPPGDAKNRPILNYAHGTVSLGDDCAPSRRANVADTMPWLNDALDKGWVVAASDYAGSGGTGDGEHYLIAADQGRDTINAARAARNLPTGAGSDMLIYGVSQGGLISLAAAAQTKDYAPELHLVADAANAPASDITRILASDPPSLQNGWVVTPFLVEEFSKVYPELDPTAFLTPQAAARNHEMAAAACTGTPAPILLPRLAMITGLGDYFASDPVQNPAWRRAFDENRAPAMTPGVPVFVAHGLQDELVPADTSAALIERYCAAGTPVTTQWVPDGGHDANTEKAVLPHMLQWFTDRLDGKPAPSNCADPLPLAPAPPVG